MFYQVLMVLSCAGIALAASPADDWPQAYDVQWSSPSADCRGSMPLGNGEVALNAWIEPDGALRFYIGRSDAWGDNGRLLKLGRVRIALDPVPDTSRNFRQRLHLQDGTMTAAWGEGDDSVFLRLWVEASSPLIHVELTSKRPTKAAASIELWRTEPTEIQHLEVSDVLLDREHPEGKRGRLIVEPDTVLHDWPMGIGWYHYNTKSVGLSLTAKIQGLAEFARIDPLLHRIFGAVVTSPGGRRLDDMSLQSPEGTTHRFHVFVHACHPSTPDEWLETLLERQKAAEAVPLEERRAAHEEWWRQFWNRSHLLATSTAPATPPRIIPENKHPVRVGIDQAGGNRLRGALGRVSLWNRPLSEEIVAQLSTRSWDQPPGIAGAALFSGVPQLAQTLEDSANWDLAPGLTIEVWVNPESLPQGGGRLVDKLTPGGSDGFLFDTFPGNSLRLIVGQHVLQVPDVLPPGRWTHVAAVVDQGAGEIRLAVAGKTVARKLLELRDPAFVVTQGYVLQRFIAACAGRGPYPIKFNGSLFTVAWPGTEGDADYRRWGPGYWWQNTRLPYYAMCAAGDFDLMQPLFQMYGRDLMPLFQYRTRRYFNHDGIFIPECIYFWGDVFSETYGWKPFEERGEDKLQTSRWHKWEWVSGLELAWLMLDYAAYSGDSQFLREVAIPTANAVLTFFDRHYSTGDDGKLVMHPAQALETWWDCTNPMPELAGLHAVTARLLVLPATTTTTEQRQFWTALQAKLPDLPIRAVDGVKMLAPAAQFATKRNIENPELYAVFPFRLLAFEKPDRDLALQALRHRLDRGHNGWRQDDVFMAYLGLAEEARDYVVGRASEHNADSRFPAFWGPNYDWVPDQDHGSVLMIALQAMAMQCDGRRIFVLPAWPRDWNVQFKLWAPERTTVEVVYREGKLQRLDVQPAERLSDVVLPEDLRSPPP